MEPGLGPSSPPPSMSRSIRGLGALLGAIFCPSCKKAIQKKIREEVIKDLGNSPSFHFLFLWQAKKAAYF